MTELAQISAWLGQFRQTKKQIFKIKKDVINLLVEYQPFMIIYKARLIFPRWNKHEPFLYEEMPTIFEFWTSQWCDTYRWQHLRFYINNQKWIRAQRELNCLRKSLCDDMTRCQQEFEDLLNFNQSFHFHWVDRQRGCHTWPPILPLYQ